MIAADGQAIGEVAAVFLDSDAWRVDSLRIKLRIGYRSVSRRRNRLFGSRPGLRQVLPGGGGPVPSH